MERKFSLTDAAIHAGTRKGYTAEYRGEGRTGAPHLIHHTNAVKIDARISGF